MNRSALIIMVSYSLLPRENPDSIPGEHIFDIFITMSIEIAPFDKN